MRTEVDGELHGVAVDAVGAVFGFGGEAEWGDAVIADLGEELDLSLAKHIDGLHGVAYEEDGAMVGGFGSWV